MADDDDDYLSDKFLVDAASSSAAPKTYHERRKEADRQARLKNEQNRLKSRRQLELESREEGLSKSLFERAKEEQDAGVETGNKALSIMMKMGFKPGQSLGKADDVPNAPAPETPEPSVQKDSVPEPISRAKSTEPGTKPKHKTEPLPLNEWTGKKGIGLGKRARSPTSAERVAKMAKMAEEASHSTFRDRARQDYEERRAEGRLNPAQSTCITLDEKADKSFNVLWLNPTDADTFPEGLLDALSDQNYQTLLTAPQPTRTKEHAEARLKRQMQADALQSLSELEDDTAPMKKAAEKFSPEVVAEATQFMRLNAQDRLSLVLGYLRDKYAYCFWCGRQYDDTEDMDEQCPGPDEDSHD